jgi:DNA-binding NarL/FixJ family response regulator
MIAPEPNGLIFVNHPAPPWRNPLPEVAIYSTHPLVAAGVAGLLPKGTNTTISASFSALNTHLAISRPGVAIIDVDASFSVEILEQLRRNAPETHVMMLVNSIPAELMAQVISLGVRGLVSRISRPETLMACYEAVRQGQMWIQKELAPLSPSRRVSLSRRERDVVSFLIQGLTNAEIAWQMRITEGSVKVYMSRLFTKTGAPDRFALALLALKNAGTFAPTPGDARTAGTVVPSTFMLSGAAPLPPAVPEIPRLLRVA